MLAMILISTTSRSPTPDHATNMVPDHPGRQEASHVINFFFQWHGSLNTVSSNHPAHAATASWTVAAATVAWMWILPSSSSSSAGLLRW